jgi:CHAD domain-containing protein
VARFEPGEALPDAFRRVAADEIAAIRAALTDPKIGRGEAVHKARRSFKRLRALLRLARPALGPAFVRENRRWRDAGRLLADSREATVLLETFDRVVGECGPDLPEQAVMAIRGRLADSSAKHSGDADDRVEAVLLELDRAEQDVKDLAWPKRRKQLRKGLRRVQARLRRTWTDARERPEPENLHEWRKRVKDAVMQIGLFRALLPKEQKARREEGKALAQALGEEHDLSVLGAALRSHGCPRGTKRAHAALLRAIAAKREALAETAFATGEAVSSQGPKRFAREIVASWSDAAEKAK